MALHRRDWLRLSAGGLLGAGFQPSSWGAGTGGQAPAPLRITGLKVTPIALPDPPLLFAGGCHGPYFLRNVVELETDGKIIGLGETTGNQAVTRALERAQRVVIGRNAFSYRDLAREFLPHDPAVYAALELACLDACGKATGRRLCELVGGPVRESVPFAAYLFYRYAADHPTVLADPRIQDGRGRSDRALDAWGEVRTPEAMAAMAAAFRERWGFRVFKLKAGVLAPDAEYATLQAIAERIGTDGLVRIDPNGRWRTETAVRLGKKLAGLPLEYYEDPVRGQSAMADVREATGLRMSTNMCVTRFEHLAEAFRRKPIDVLLTDLHYFGGFAGNLALGPVAEAAGWTLSQHSNNHAGITMAAMIHLAATVPQLTMASDTHYVWLPDEADILAGPKLAIRGGAMTIPNGPGLGVSLDRDKLARAHEVYQKCGMRQRDDIPLMRRLEPDWTGEPL